MPQLFRRWTEEEERLLLELKQSGKSVALIAKILKRTEASVSNKLGLIKENES